MKLPFLCCTWLLWLHSIIALAQATTVSGRVLQAGSGRPISGATVLQVGTTNGTSTNSLGNFTLSVPAAQDSVVVRFSSVGYTNAQRSVGSGSFITVQLDSTALIYQQKSAWATVGLTSGLRYTPFGVQARMFGRRLFHVPVTAATSYRTNLRHNSDFVTSLFFSIANTTFRGRGLQIGNTLLCQRLRIPTAAVQFAALTGILHVHLYSVGNIRLPALAVGVGHGELQGRHDGANVSTAGIGYVVGLERAFALPVMRSIEIDAQATRWPSYWQWQIKLRRDFLSQKGYRAELTGTFLPGYSEIVALVSRLLF